jgi:hypothetical protein
MRDLLIGAVPPAAISDWRYLAGSLLAGLVVFFWYPSSERLRNLRNHVLVFDAAGLALLRLSAPKGARQQTQSADGCTAWRADRNWWRHVADCRRSPLFRDSIRRYTARLAPPSCRLAAAV